MDIIENGILVIDKVNNYILKDIELMFDSVHSIYKLYKYANEEDKNKLFLNLYNDYVILYEYVKSIINIYENDTEEEDLYYVELLLKYKEKLEKIASEVVGLERNKDGK